MVVSRCDTIERERSIPVPKRDGGQEGTERWHRRRFYQRGDTHAQTGKTLNICQTMASRGFTRMCQLIERGEWGSKRGRAEGSKRRGDRGDQGGQRPPELFPTLGIHNHDDNAQSPVTAWLCDMMSHHKICHKCDI